MWRARTPDPAQVQALQAIRRKRDIHPLVVHVNYLVNLASRDPEIRARSIATFRGELDRAATVGAEFLVVHPGSYKNQALDDAVSACAEGLCEAMRVVAKMERAGAHEPALLNVTAAATLVIAGALARRESRGGHFRTDYPNTAAHAERTFLTLAEAHKIGEAALAPQLQTRAAR